MLGLALLGALPGAHAAPHATDVLDRISRTVALTALRSIRVDATVADVTIAASERTDLAVEDLRRAPTAADLRAFRPSSKRRAKRSESPRCRRRRTRCTTESRHPCPGAGRGAIRRRSRVRRTGSHHRAAQRLRRRDKAGQDRSNRGRRSRQARERRWQHRCKGSVADARRHAAGCASSTAQSVSASKNNDRTPPDARILALTFNGSIASDIPLAMKDTFGPRFGEATLGAGEPVMSIDVVTGDITIRSAVELRSAESEVRNH